jgi:hypothetical protein
MDLPEVNHINENKLDNRAENLEWCDRAYNVNFGGRTEQQKAKVSKSVVQLSTNDEVIAVFPSGIQAAREFQISSSAITACCRGNRKTAGGFKWKYEKEVDK